MRLPFMPSAHYTRSQSTTGLEVRDESYRDIDGFPCLRVASHPLRKAFGRKGAEVANFDPITMG